MLHIKHPATIFFTSVMLLSFISTAHALTAREIMEKVDARDDGDNMTANVEMILIDKNNNHRIRKMKVFTKDKGKNTWKLQFFLAPADVKDTGFLTYDYYEGNRDDDQWLYLPDLYCRYLSKHRQLWLDQMLSTSAATSTCEICGLGMLP